MFCVVLYVALIFLLFGITKKLLSQENLDIRFRPVLYILGLIAVIMVNNWMTAVVLAFAVTAAEMDRETKTVYGYLSFIPLLFLLILCFMFISKGKNMPPVIAFLPLLFSVATCFTRGLADTLFMCTFSVYGLICSDPLAVLIGFLLSYLIQFGIKVYGCIKEHRPYKEGKNGENALPFMPALTIGFILVQTLYTLL